MSDLRVPSINTLVIAGRLTRDPDQRFTQSGQAFCNAGICNTRYYRDGEGKSKEEKCFVDFTCWAGVAEYVGKLAKGRPVLIEGSLKLNEWTDRESGQKRSKIQINAQRVVALDWDAKNSDDRGGQGARSTSPPQQQAEAAERTEAAEAEEDIDIPF